MQDLPLGPGNLVQTDKRREGEASFSLVCSSSTMERFFFLRRVKTIAFSQLDKDKRRRAHFLSLFLFHHALSLLCRARSSKKKVTTTTLPAAALKGKEKRWTSPRPLPPPAAASPMAGAAYTLLSGGIALVCSWKVVLHTGSRAVLSGGRGGQQVLLQGGQSPNQHPCSEGTLCGAGALAQG